MVRLHGPLFSEKAQKQLGKKLIYKRKGSRSLLTKYNKPGGVSPFDPSPTQINKRTIYNLIIANWQTKTPAQKKVFDDLAKSKNLKMSGWNYFYQQSSKDLPTYLGLQGYWSFNQIANGKILDLSGNKNHGTPLPSYPANYPHLVDSIKKKLGKAGSFDGIDDAVNCGIGDSLNIAEDVSISFLINPSTPTEDFEILVAKRLGVDRSYQVYLERAVDNRVLSWYDGLIRKGTYIFPEGVYTHAVVVLDNSASEVSFYINGAFHETITGTIGTPHAGNLWISKDQAASQYFHGKMDEIMIFDKILPPEEIKRLYDLMYA